MVGQLKSPHEAGRKEEKWTRLKTRKISERLRQ
nr:MAG TPA: hypothetical protein [Bacteriophage sp.]